MKYIDGDGSRSKYGERKKNILKVIIFKNMKKIKYNFDVETINLKIDKALLKIKYAFTLYAQFTTNKYYTHNNTLFEKNKYKIYNISSITT